MKKRLVAFLLVLIMVLGMLPVSAMAAGSVVTARGSAENPIRIYENSGNQAETSNGSVQVPVGETVTDSGVLTFSTYSAIEGVQVSKGGVYCAVTSSNENVVKATGSWSGGVLTINFLGVGNGTAKITVDYTCTCSKNAVANGLLIYNVTVGDGGSTDPSGKPNAPTASDIGAFPDAGKAVLLHCVDAGARGHDATASSLNKVQNGYSVGEVVENPGTYYNVDGGKITKEQFPWMCVVTVHAAPFIELYNSNFSERYGVHKLAGTSNATATLHWFWHNTYGWQYLENPPIQFNITRDTSEKTYTLNYYKNTTDTVTNMPEPNPQTEKSNTGMVTFTVSSAIPAREGYNFLGWNGKPDATEPTVMPGNTITTPRETTNLYAVWESKTPPPEIPGDQKPNIEEANAKIRVQCIEYPSKHNPYKQNYRILPGSYDDLGWDRTEYGYIYSIRLNRAKYIAQFDQEIGRPHTDTEPNKETRINWRWENDAWHLIDGPDGVTADIKVKCAETPVKPEKPTALDGSFAIVCKNNEATHAYKADYIATPRQYTISDVQKDEQGYYVTATVTVAPNLVAYNTLTGAEHRLVDELDATLTILFRYDPEATGDENRKWKQQDVIPVVEVKCAEIKEPTRDDIFKALNGPVTVTCINRFWKDGNKNMDCGQGQYAAKAGIVGQDYTLVKGEDAGTWVVTFPVTNFVKSFKQDPAHNLYTKDTLSWYIRWKDNAWTSAPVEPGVDDLVKLTHAPTDWREVAKIATGGKSDCIHTLCKNSGLNVCDYGITVPFVNFNEDVVSVVPEEGKPGSYIATFRVDKFVDARAKVCNDKNFPDAPRTHKLLTQETVQWRLYATSEADEKIGNNVLNHVWAADPVTPGTDDVCEIAHNWVVTFDPNGGTPVPLAQEVEYGHTATKPVEPTLKGYTFDGWYLDGEEEPFDFGTTITSDITLTAKWEINKYTVTFDSYGGSKVDPQVVEYGLYAQEPEEPTLKGFTFAYWYLDDENEAYDFDTTPITSDITLTAKWNINKYTVAFNTDGGTPVPPAQEVEYGLTATEPAAPEKTGYTFDGWYLGDEKYDFSAAVEQNITLTAKWQKKTFTVKYYLPDETGAWVEKKMDTVDSVDYATYSLWTPNAEDGYEFSGWYQKTADIGVKAKVEKLYMAKEWKLYGKFTPIEYNIQYVYNDGKATSTNPTTYTVESDAITLADATGADWGKTFLEWHDENDQKITEIPTGSTGDRVITAYWNWPVHLHYLDKDNNEIESATLYVSELEPGACVLPTGEKTGYDFDGWYEAKKDIGTASHKLNALSIAKKWELYGRYTAKTDVSYTVKYLREGDNKVLAPEKVVTDQTFDTEVTEQAADVVGYTPDAPSKTMILDEYNKVLTFSYSANTYDYTVRHIKQLPDGSYDEANAEVETLSGKFEALAAVTAKDYGSHYPTNDADTKQNIKIEEGLTIDVKYDLDEHTLTFETNGGSAINPVTVRHGNAVARPADPTKDKYTFIGWYADPEFTEEYDFATVLEADKTIYAKFELTSTPIGDIYVRYDVLHIKQLPDGTYDLANAEVEHLSAKKDTTVTAVIKDYRATHHVNVNRTLSKLTGTAIQPYMGVDGKPVYTILSVYYDLDFHTLTFDTMGGSKIAPETVRHGLTVAKPKDPVNGGYIFDGWYTDKTYRTPYNFATPLTQDTTIYAKWFLIVLPGVTVKKNTPKLNTADHFAYVQGYPDGTVKPAGNITRAETAAILFRLMDDASRKTYYSTKSGFRDVASGSWYNTYVATLNNAGVITDSSNGYFRPNEAITRAELAAMLAKFSETTGAANYFNDVSASYWAANAIAICAKLGWINGYPDGTFRPDKNVTRAELMAMINRATGRAPKSADAFLPGMKTWIDNTSDKWYYLDVQEATNSHSYTVKGSETWTALTSDPNWSLYE